ncbi:MAG: hypothetical protein IPL74_13780 [Bacteroidetes bacterium]|nr:hypothetical protein [Bacteroidota bacterium]
MYRNCRNSEFHNFHTPNTPTANNATGCAGTPISLSGSPAGGIFSVANPYTGPSTTFTYTITTINGCNASTPATITVNPLPTVTAGNVTGCTGTPVSLVGSPAGGTFSVTNPYTGPSTTYTYTYTNGNGCTNTSAPATITVTPLPTVTAETYQDVQEHLFHSADHQQVEHSVLLILIQDLPLIILTPTLTAMDVRIPVHLQQSL